MVSFVVLEPQSGRNCVQIRKQNTPTNSTMTKSLMDSKEISFFILKNDTIALFNWHHNSANGSYKIGQTKGGKLNPGSLCSALIPDRGGIGGF